MMFRRFHFFRLVLVINMIIQLKYFEFFSNKHASFVYIIILKYYCFNKNYNVSLT